MITKPFISSMALLLIIAAAGGFLLYNNPQNLPPDTSELTKIPELEATENVPETPKQEEAVLPKESADLPGCKAAFAPEIYIDKEFKIYEEARELIRKYRKNWQDVCLGKKEKNLYPLWVEAQELSKQFEAIAEEGYYTISAPGYPDAVYLREQLPSFMPGFDEDSPGTVEGEVFGVYPTMDAFILNLPLGIEEDKNYFNTMTSIPDWFVWTWDYGGCPDYANYDWAKTLLVLDNVLSQLTQENYIAHVENLRSQLLGEFDEPFYESTLRTYTDEKEKIIENLAKTLVYMKDNPFYKENIPQLQDFISKIKTGEVVLTTHCGG